MNTNFRRFNLFGLALVLFITVAFLSIGTRFSPVAPAQASGGARPDSPAVDDPYCDSAHYKLSQAMAKTGWTSTLNENLSEPSPTATGVVFRPASAQAQTVDIGVGQFAVAFEPDHITINAGDTVRWTWFGGPHTVTSGNTTTCAVDNVFCSPNNGNCSSAGSSNTGTVYSRTFSQAGLVTYFCKIHCAGGMTGRITVNAVQIRPTANDFDGDGKADLVVFRPADGNWYELRSSNNSFVAQPFGSNGDAIVPGDYDGDQKTDVAVFRPSTGSWFILQSSNNTFRGVGFGVGTDIPVANDFDGDGKTDVAVFRPSEGNWYLLQSSNGAFRAFNFGLSGDRPVPGDYDADGKADIAVYRPAAGSWYLMQSSDNTFHAVTFGSPTDKPVPADYDGDGKTDFAVFRPSEGNWYSLQSTAGYRAVNFGLGTDTPAPADFDGDGKTDVGVYRGGNWYTLLSTNGSFRSSSFGSPGDLPAPAAYIQ